MDILIALLNSPIIQNALVGMVTTVIAIVIGWLGLLFHRLLDRRISAAGLEFLGNVAHDAVLYAEQTGLGKLSAEKKAEAVFVVQQHLDTAGVKMDASSIEAAIEAEVYRQFTTFTPPLPADGGPWTGVADPSALPPDTELPDETVAPDSAEAGIEGGAV